MPLQTTNRGLPYPEGEDPARVPDDMRKLAEALDNDAEINSGLLADRPDPGQGNLFYWASDVNNGTGMLSYDDGATWQDIGPGAIADGTVTNAKLANSTITNAKKAEPLGSAATGVLDVPSGTGQFNVIGLAFQPKIVKFTFCPDFNGDSLAAMGVGAATGPSSRWAVSSRASGSDLRHRNVQNRCIYIVDSGGAVQLSVDFVGMNTDGFTLDVKNNNGNDFFVAWEAYG